MKSLNGWLYIPSWLLEDRELWLILNRLQFVLSDPEASPPTSQELKALKRLQEYAEQRLDGPALEGGNHNGDPYSRRA